MELKFKKVIQREHHYIEFIVDYFAKYFSSVYENILSDEQIALIQKFASYETIRNEIRSREKTFFLVFLKDTPIGFVELFSSNKTLYLDTIYLEGNYQNKNLSKNIMSYLEKYAKDNGLKEIVSFVCDKSQTCLSYFRSFGYKVIGHVAKYYGSGIYVNCYKIEKEL